MSLQPRDASGCVGDYHNWHWVGQATDGILCLCGSMKYRIDMWPYYPALKEREEK